VLWLNEMTKAPGSNWKTDKFSYIYGIGWDPQVLQVDPKGPYSTLAALKGGKNLKFAVSSAQGNFALGIMTVARALGIEGKVIPGMKGEAECALSVKQGESAALVTPLTPAIRTRDSIGLKPVAVLAGKRDSRLPEVPALGELIPLKEEDKFLIEQVWGELMRSTWVNIGPPGLSSDKLTYLRKTADKIVASPDVIPKLPGVMLYTPTSQDMLSGERLQKLADEIRKLESKISGAFADMITRYLKM
jgi:tripartite-type tricarboxylate transporter receptor subunit TctC